MDTKRVVTISICLLIWGPFIFVLMLTIRDLEAKRDAAEVPQEIRKYYTRRIYDESRYKDLQKNWVALFRQLYDITILTVVLMGELIYAAWNYSVKIADYYNIKGELKISIIMSLMIATVKAIIDIPFAFVMMIVDETSVVECVIKWILQYIGLLLAAVVFTVLVYYIAKAAGRFLFAYLGVTMTILLFILLLIADDINASTQEHSKLNNSVLQEKIENLTHRVNIPTDKIYIIHTEEINAFFLGFFGNKRIMMSDDFLNCIRCNVTSCYRDLIPCPENKTTISSNVTYERRYTDEEVLAVISHEIGHWKGYHFAIRVVYVELQLLFIWLVCSYVYRKKYIYDVFCFKDTYPYVVGVFLTCAFILIPYERYVSELFGNVLSRHCEYAADAYAKDLGYRDDLISALTKLHADIRAFPVRDKLASIFLQSHPSLMERIYALES